MKKIPQILFFLLFATAAFAQNVSKDSIDAHRRAIEAHRVQYIKDLLSPEKPVLSAEKAAEIKFFPPDINYKIVADFVRIPYSQPFDLLTSSGKVKSYRKYGEAIFLINNKQVKISVYQSMQHLAHPLYKDYLFIPFKDLTTGETTYGAGRYLDARFSDIAGDKMLLDFNKCYNPYCAYSDGYNCPIPPQENHLEVAIEAGILNFEK